MIPVETVPGITGRSRKEGRGRAKFKYDISDTS
jgi:hypothetical protein